MSLLAVGPEGLARGVRRIRSVDLMLLLAVGLWALHLSVARYILTHGFAPLAYAGTRYSAAALIFAAVTGRRENAIRLPRGRLLAVAGAATLLLYANQLGFVYAVRMTTASTVGLISGVTPIVTALTAFLLGIERVTRGFLAAALLSFAGVGIVAAGSTGGLSASLGGDTLALSTAFTWGAYSVAIASLMRHWSPYRISAVVLLATASLLVVTSIPQLLRQNWSALSTLTWLGFAFAVLGPLVLTNLLWFTAIDRVGPSHATLFANLQPFVAVVFAVLLLAERPTLEQIGGGIAIAVAVVLAWTRMPALNPSIERPSVSLRPSPCPESSTRS